MSKVEWSSKAGGCVVGMGCVARCWCAEKQKRFVAWRGAVSNDEEDTLCHLKILLAMNAEMQHEEKS